MAKFRMPKKERRAVGARLRAARESLNLTQGQAARKLGLRSFTTLSNYEQGRTEVPNRIWPRMAELYRTRVDTFLTGAVEPYEVDFKTRRLQERVLRGVQLLVQDLVKAAREIEGLIAKLKKDGNNNNHTTTYVRSA